MKVKTMNSITGLTVAEQQAAINWLEDAAVSASNKSEQAIQAENALRILKLREYIIKLQADANKLQGDIIKNQDNTLKRKSDFIERQADIIKRQDDMMKGLYDFSTVPTAQAAA
jgi:TolA-binding protein